LRIGEIESFQVRKNVGKILWNFVQVLFSQEKSFNFRVVLSRQMNTTNFGNQSRTSLINNCCSTRVDVANNWPSSKAVVALNNFATCEGNKDCEENEDRFHVC
jgi:hypothetical protein